MLIGRTDLLKQEQVAVNELSVMLLSVQYMSNNLGKADLTAVAKSKSLPQPVPDERCADGFLKIADITHNNLVFKFEDLSLLFGDGNGVVCLDFANGALFAGVDGTWLGGTGRFRGATGEFSVRFDEVFEVSTETRVVAETGTITGMLYRDE